MKKEIVRLEELDDPNPFLFEYAKILSMQIDYDYDIIEKEMSEGGLDNCVSVFNNYFGDYVEIV